MSISFRPNPTPCRDSRWVATASVSFAEVLANIAPGAAMIRLSSAEGGLPRTVEAYDAQRNYVPQPLQIRQAIASWIIQTFPVDRNRAHELDLATGHLIALAEPEDLPLAA
jgi:hypothetical protein